MDRDQRITLTNDYAAASTLRPLGAFENIIDLYISRNPVQFSIVIELTSPITEEELTGTLAALQRTHPLLASSIDRTGEQAVFRPTSEPIPLRVSSGHDWVVEASAEQAAPIDPDLGPLARATLVDTMSGFVVILTFSHQIADGRGALRAVTDLLEILDGRTPPAQPIPASQEQLLRSLPDGAAAATPTASAGLERPAAVVRAFDGTPPTVEVAALDWSTTERLRVIARSHDATVQGALCAAAAQALSARGITGPVRINAPIDLRSAVGLPDDVANRFTATTVALDDPQGRDFWPLAQDATAQLRTGRVQARAAALMLAALQPTDAMEAEAAMLAATDADIEITNLGIFAPRSDAAEAVWGPMMTTQVQGECVLGVVTHGGALRLTLTGHDDIGGLAADVAARLSRQATQQC
ncbi:MULTISPECIES: peptide synthetase [unclassified Microbacterium]|uniref:peptide synthetase n=1 Tax=unclassified Microbacterium TaxID=2609290 RepID=UPI000EA987ED|nr:MULTISPECIES: peptide synthetase [unclassified Microbacterium]MBT2486429.1 hypothetical protein [Microbacterium sp. ISL-108]RKN69129.1 peptide synthetase [Microbacterium sp. CGR2]